MARERFHQLVKSFEKGSVTNGSATSLNRSAECESERAIGFTRSIRVTETLDDRSSANHCAIV